MSKFTVPNDTKKGKWVWKWSTSFSCLFS
jgi:hypothetical protein